MNTCCFFFQINSAAIYLNFICSLMMRKSSGNETTIAWMYNNMKGVNACMLLVICYIVNIGKKEIYNVYLVSFSFCFYKFSVHTPSMHRLKITFRYFWLKKKNPKFMNRICDRKKFDLVNQRWTKIQWTFSAYNSQLFESKRVQKVIDTCAWVCSSYWLQYAVCM